jgi:hypothetical protein
MALRRIRRTIWALRSRLRWPVQSTIGPYVDAAHGKQLRRIDDDDALRRYAVARGLAIPTARSFGFADRPPEASSWILDLEAEWPIELIRVRTHRHLASLLSSISMSVGRTLSTWHEVHKGPKGASRQVYPDLRGVLLQPRRFARFVRVDLAPGRTADVHRLEVLVDADDIALRTVARRYGFDYGLLTGVSGSTTDRHPYILRPAPADPNRGLDALFVDRLAGRFGNNLRQVITALRLAECLGLAKVYLADMPYFSVHRRVEHDGVALVAASEFLTDTPATVLCGPFYQRTPFRRSMARIRARDQARIVDQFVRPIFQPPAPANPTVEPTDGDLVIHIRSGDIFSRPDPNSGYTQPPLAYYQLCVRQAIEKLGIGRVVLVYEDDLNPCIDALKRWLFRTGVRFQVQAASWDEDLAVLLAGRHCVFGHGSLGPAIVLLSTQMITVFHPSAYRTYCALAPARGLRRFGVRDAAGCYTKQGDWRNTPEQLRLMIDYPIESLVVDDSGA